MQSFKVQSRSFKDWSFKLQTSKLQTFKFQSFQFRSLKFQSSTFWSSKFWSFKVQSPSLSRELLYQVFRFLSKTSTSRPRLGAEKVHETPLLLALSSLGLRPRSESGILGHRFHATALRTLGKGSARSACFPEARGEDIAAESPVTSDAAQLGPRGAWQITKTEQTSKWRKQYVENDLF